MRNIFLGFVLAISLVSCSSEPVFTLINLSESKAMVENYYESGQFDRETKDIIDKAISEIEVMPLPEKPAAIFDVDETALSNYKHTKEIGFGYVPELWRQWIVGADARAIKQVKRFYDYLVSKNVRVVFLTGRNPDTYNATRSNLINEGYTKIDTLITRSEMDRGIQATEFKSAKRNELVQKGYTIITSVGDQWSDHVGGNAGIKVKIPNYLYTID